MQQTDSSDNQSNKSKILLLDEALINKIAAGEVVERPASVVKELVENSLDSGATQILVDIEEGGRKRITVSDNGSGMSREDAAMSLRRHATSKIATSDDLFKIQTMGFRGEALASIASISKVTVMTSAGVGEATKIYTQDSIDLNISPTNRSQGTTIHCEELFFNTPARLKFLKTPAVETSAILELMQSIALCYPKVEFSLIQNQKTLLRATAETSDDAESLRRRAESIFGSELVESLIPLKQSSEFGGIWGLISPPGLEKNYAKFMFTYVNRRFVKDKNLRFSVQRGYHSYLMKGKYPVVILFLELDPSIVDVNVHPAKTEVRFQYQAEIQGFVAMAIREAIRAPVNFNASKFMARNSDGSSSRSEPIAPSIPKSDWSKGFSEFASIQSPVIPKTSMFTASSAHLGQRKETVYDFSAKFSQTDLPVKSTLTEPVLFSEKKLDWAEFHFLGQFAKCYLIFTENGASHHEDRLLVVDQHAFHERILYEKILERQTDLLLTQKLFIPEWIDLPADKLLLLKENKSNLEQLGFSFICMNESTNQGIEVTGVPQILAKKSVEESVIKMIDAYAMESKQKPHQEVFHDVLSTLACHSAVRSGEDLNADDLQQLLIQASSVDFTLNCPHGRPVFKWWERDQVGRWFDR